MKRYTAQIWFFIIFWLLLAFFEAPIAVWKHSYRIRCDQDGIEVDYLLHVHPGRMEWAEIKQLDISGARCVLRSQSSTLSFSAPQARGIKDFPTLIRTIIDRSGLQFVGANIRSATYKTFDAP